MTTGFEVSVIIPAYNAERVIARAIDSVLAQSRRPDEIIVIDDGSADRTAEIVHGYGPEVRCIQQVNAGVSVARNSGIAAAQCPWIAFLDADDEWLQKKLQSQLALLERNPQLVWVAANYDCCSQADGRRAAYVKPEAAENLLAKKDYFDDYFAAFQADVAGWTGTMIVKRDVLEQVGLFEPGRDSGEDLDLWWRIAYRRPQIGYVSRPLAIYHLDMQQSLTREKRSLNLYCDLIDRHLKLAEEHGRLKAFVPCAVFMIRRWIRGMLFDQDRSADIRAMTRQFRHLLTWRYRATIRLLTQFPAGTATACRLISRVVRTFRLRRRVVSRPR